MKKVGILLVLLKCLYTLYICLYTLYKYMCVKSEVPDTNIAGIIGINVTKREQIWLPNDKYIE